MAEIITVANRKGGVGKTTTTLNLAYSLRELGKKVFVIDLDPQANLTRCFGIENANELTETIGHLLMAELEEEENYSVEEYILSYDGIDFIPSSIYLSVTETQMKSETGKRILSSILEPMREQYDYILIDTSPSLNILTINALCASDSVLITADTQLFAIVGISELLKTIQKIKKRVNESLMIKGILLTMCDNRTNLSKLLTQQVEEMYQGKIEVFQTKIPKTVKVGEAIYSGQSVKKYAKGSSVDIAYDNLAKEICYE